MLNIKKALLLEDSNNNDMHKVIMGFSIKWFIICVWCIPWTVFMGIFLDFSTFYWGLMEYFYVILLVFILTVPGGACSNSSSSCLLISSK